jgi:hypothetical protein
MLKTIRATVVPLVLSALLLAPGAAQAQTCQPGIAEGFALFPTQYTALLTALIPAQPTLQAQLDAVVDQDTYATLLATSRALAGLVTPNGRVVITLPDGTVVVDTSRADDPTNVMPVGNSFAHFQSKTVNENHNSRVAIFMAQEYPCGFGLESKLSTSTGQREIYVAGRLGTHLDSSGTARISIRQ